jgi:hypothetical protein
MVGETLVSDRLTVVVLISLGSNTNYREAALRVAELAAWRLIE